ncbi:Peroxisome biogenesis protein 5 (Peroxin-5) (AtPEX5) (Peroxisomal targeting signal type 1 receptor) (Pex5p) [Durusdinium trenchii]|uniref:Peroxisome biogenesis protein 5 (Peroxin-5) (AtPEX5) (Peroxisomal targeting signal type 1 receptor) (Pex5p) n=1 Tax=Durusdinium trenchii TaxID=1381693 RepID=A0ABP0KY39_9DINO
MSDDGDVLAVSSPEDPADHAVDNAELASDTEEGFSTPYMFDLANPFLDDPRAFARGKQLFHNGKLEAAVMAFEAAVLAETSNVEALMMLGEAHSENGKDEVAAQCFGKALDLDPDNLGARLEMMVCALNQQDLRNTRRHARAWLKRHPKLQELAEDSDELLTLEFAREAATRVIPDDAGAHTVLGIVCYVENQLDAAITALKSACELEPTNYRLLNKLAACLNNADRPAEGIPVLKAALKIKSRYKRGRINLGLSYIRTFDFENAAVCFLTVLADTTPSLWGDELNFLGLTLAMMEREDLLDKFESMRHSGNVNLFRQDFDY